MKQGVLIANRPIFGGPYGLRCVVGILVEEKVLHIQVPDYQGKVVHWFERVVNNPRVSVFREWGLA